MTLDTIAKRFVPAFLYARLARSPMAKRLARGSLWTLLGTGISRILVLVAMILAARILGKVSFGEFGLIQSTLGMFGIIAGMGLGNTATRFVAQCAVSEKDRAGRIIALVHGSSIVTVLASAALLVATSGLISNRFLEAPHLQSAVVWGTLLLVANALRSIQNAVLAGLERFDIIAKLNIVEGLLALPAIILFATLLSVEGALFGLALSATVVWILGRVLLVGELRARGIVIRYQGAWNDWRILPKYSLPSLLSSALTTPVVWLAMLLVVRTDHGFAGLASYNAAYQWVGPIEFLPMILMNVSIPIMVQEWEDRRYRRFENIFFFLSGFAFLFIFSVAGIVGVVSPNVMSLYGPDFRESWIVLAVLMAAAPFLAIGKIATAALYGMNRAWLVFLVRSLWGAVLIGTVFGLVDEYGGLGLAAAFLIAHILMAIVVFVVVVFLTRSNMGLSQKNKGQ